jgi:hypothetical protein
MESIRSTPGLVGNAHAQASAPGAVKRRMPEETPSASGKPPEGSAESAILTHAEKEYFASAFPSAAGEIRQHATYRRNGGPGPAALGTVVDRKG